MRIRRICKCTAVALQLLCILLFWCCRCMAHPGGFWYGTYNTPSYPETFGELHTKYKMNWAITGIMDAAKLQALKDNGLRAVNAPYFYDNYPHVREDSNKVGWYSYSFFLHLNAAGDTVAWEWNPDEGAEHVIQKWGVRVVDTFALSHTAWYFDPARDTARDTAGYIRFWNRDYTSDKHEAINLRFRYRSVPGSGSGPLAYLILKSHSTHATLFSKTVSLSDITDTLYHELVLPVSNSDQTAPWETDVIVEWTGARKMWVDWLGYDSPRGYDVMKPDVTHTIKDFAQVYGFGNDPAILGFYMAEELWSDGNIYPQKRIDSLINDTCSNQKGWTENHYLVWWDSRHQYGGRDAASYRLQKEKHHTMLSYPFTGYNPLHQRVTAAGIVHDTTKYVYGWNPCQLGDTSICLQQVFDTVASDIRFHKRFADSMSATIAPGALFVPFMQAHASWIKREPTNCADTIIPWVTKEREPTDAETRAHAALALANGANGLLYCAYGSYNEYAYPASITVPCEGGDTVISFKNNKEVGLVDLPGVQSALQNWIGPFVDSLGHFFADFSWQGGGRLDPRPSGIQGCFVDSVRSLTLPSEQYPYVEGGFYKLGADDYFMLVNRRAYDTASQMIRAWLHRNAGMYYVVDQYSHDTVLTGTMDSTVHSVPFTTSLSPGEGKLFKIIQAPALVSGNSLPATWQGGIRVGGDVTMAASRTWTILPPARVVVTADSDYCIDVHGNLVAEGTSADSIHIVSSVDNMNKWNGITVLGAGNVSMKYAEVRDAYRGVWLYNTSDQITANIEHCQFNRNYLAGVAIDADSSSDISITHSSFCGGLYYGVQIHQGFVDVQNNLFTGGGLNGVRVDGAYQGVMTGGHIWYNDFDSLNMSCATGVYIYGVTDDGLTSENLLQDNHFTRWLGSSQAGIQVINCPDPLRIFRNAIEGTSGAPEFGVLNYSTKLTLLGDTNSPQASSRISHCGYGLGCYSESVSDSDYAKVRCVPFESSGDNVYVSSESRVNLGVDGDYGHNAFKVTNPTEGSECCCGSGQPTYSFNVVNDHSGYTVRARGNYWYDKTCRAFEEDGLMMKQSPRQQNGEDLAASKPPCELNGCWPFNQGDVDKTGYLDSIPFLSKPVPGLVSDPDEPLPYLTQNSGNYPNPFNSSTVLRFTLANPGPVEVAVFNVLGQKVKTVCNDDQGAGEHLVVWDGRDDRGRPVASGVYFYTVTTGNKRLSKSMVLLK